MFRTWVLSLAFLCSAPLFAETIGPVEFQLPQTDHGWKLDRTQKEHQITVMLYIPDNVTNGHPSEYFAATFTPQLGGVMGLESLTDMLKQQFQGQEVHVEIVEQIDDSIIFEWSAVKDPGQPGIYGWTRIMTTPHGTVSLGYVTHILNPDVAALRSTWVAVLKSATVIQK